MHIASVNIGQERTIIYGAEIKRTETTGIYKLPSVDPVDVGREGLRGDAVIDTKNHGGPDQAVYVYGLEDYDWWARELGRELAPGTFGENLTIAGLLSAPLVIGDRLQIAAVTLEVTAPRIPCRTFAKRMGDPGFVKRFRAAERPGLYCRVVREGRIAAGDAVTLLPYAGISITIGEMFRAWYEADPDEAAIRRQLAAPIATRARADQEARLQNVLARRAADSPASAE